MQPRDSREKKLDRLKRYLSARRDVVLAYLFGSCAKGTQTGKSDCDVAVYLKTDDGRLEYEESGRYPQADLIWDDAERIVGSEVDLVVLNRAPAGLAFEILRNGRQLICKDRRTWLDFLIRVSTLAEDFREFLADFWNIKYRSSSLSQADRTRLRRIVDFLKDELKEHRRFKGLDWKKFRDNSSERRNVERWIENLVNASIDIAKILLAARKKKLPETYRETLELLAILENFDANTASKLAGYCKLRNILAHEYMDIRFERVNEFLQHAEPLYRELVKYVTDLLEEKNTR